MLKSLKNSSFIVATANLYPFDNGLLDGLHCGFSVFLGVKDLGIAFYVVANALGVCLTELGCEIDLAYSFFDALANGLLGKSRSAVENEGYISAGGDQLFSDLRKPFGIENGVPL